MHSAILEAIRRRRSYFSFRPEPLSDEQMLNILEAGLLSPSASNNQPWRFHYALRGTAGFALLLGCLDEGNQVWAKDAGALVISAARVRYTYKDRKLDNPYAWHDTGLATSMILVQASSMGLESHPMGGFSREKAREVLHLDPDLEPVAAIAFGWAGDPGVLTPDLLKRQTSPRRLKPLDEVLQKI
jgi:nitroreductase